MTINDKKLLDSAHEGNPVYKFLVFYDLLSEWFKDPKLKDFHIMKIYFIMYLKLLSSMKNLIMQKTTPSQSWLA